MALLKPIAPLRVGDRVRVTRKTRDNVVLPEATVVALHEKHATIRYDDDDPSDYGYPENHEDLERIPVPRSRGLFARLSAHVS